MDGSITHLSAANGSFSPTAYLDQLVQAVLPLVCKTGDGLRENKSDDDVVLAMLPLVGHYTVADAALAIGLLGASETLIPASISNGEIDNPEAHARYLVWSALTDFACVAFATDERCAAARAHLLQAGSLGDVGLGDDQNEAIRRSIGYDVSALREKNFRSGERFGSCTWADAASNPPPDWHRRWSRG